MRIPLFIIALLGLLVSSYLLVAYVTGGPILCRGGYGCETVRASIYSAFMGVPTPAYGVLYYSLVITGALLLASAQTAVVKQCLKFLTLSGLLVSLYLTYLEAFVINAWCWWCVVSALLSVAAFVLVWLPATCSPFFRRQDL